jgi:hypothetical protein
MVVLMADRTASLSVVKMAGDWVELWADWMVVQKVEKRADLTAASSAELKVSMMADTKADTKADK